VDELSALPMFARYFKDKNLPDLVVVATDVGISKKARDLAARLNAPLAIVEKRRVGNNDKTETLNVIGDVRNKTAVLFDDEIDTAGSITNAAAALREEGARDVFACATHPVLSGPAVERIAASAITEVVVTDSIPLPDWKKPRNVSVLSVAPLLGEAIRRIHTGTSVGAMFE